MITSATEIKVRWAARPRSGTCAPNGQPAWKSPSP